MKMTEAKMATSAAAAAAAERGGMGERGVGGERVEKSEKEKRDIDERLSAYVTRPTSGKNRRPGICN